MTAAASTVLTLAHQGPPRPARRLPRPRAAGRGPLAAGGARPAGHEGPAGQVSPAVSPPGAIGAALITALRRTGRLTQRGLARRLGAGTSAVRAWEDATTPLYATSYSHLRQLAGALSTSDADTPQLLHMLVLASQCDLLITGMLHGLEDYAEVPPIDQDDPDGDLARTLLLWALTGTPPPSFSKHAPARPLLTRDDVTRIRIHGLLLQAGTQGDDLRGFGYTLAQLTGQDYR